MLRLSRDLVDAFNSRDLVTGLTHNFYRYPARFAPQFAAAVIRELTRPGDLVVDPFMGGATALVEAFACGRRAIGGDVNELAAFIARIKTTPLSDRHGDQVRNWARNVTIETLSGLSDVDRSWRHHSYLRALRSRQLWSIRDSVGLAVARLEELPDSAARDFARCVLLRVAQWAIDGHRTFPGVQEFRGQVARVAEEMVAASRALGEIAATSLIPIVRNAAADRLVADEAVIKEGPPALLLTSPPYPGVHVLYHRWQFDGGKETAAPFWIANCRDGHGEAYYTFGHRSSHDGPAFFDRLHHSFAALATLASSKTLFVQVVGFADPRYLSRYLDALQRAGLAEVFPVWAGQRTRRLWRRVPNRRWYTWARSGTPSEREVALFHQLA